MCHRVSNQTFFVFYYLFCFLPNYSRFLSLQRYYAWSQPFVCQLWNTFGQLSWIHQKYVFPYRLWLYFQNLLYVCIFSDYYLGHLNKANKIRKFNFLLILYLHWFWYLFEMISNSLFIFLSLNPKNSLKSLSVSPFAPLFKIPLNICK